MKSQESALLGLHYDILKRVMICTARSPDGAKDFARAISVCKGLRQFVVDEDVLKAVAFDDLIIADRWELFQVMGGLVCRCAKTGQVHAQFILGKVILVSTSQWVSAKEMSRDANKSDGIPKEVRLGYYFLENFLHPETCTNRVGHHFDFVKVFLRRARCSDLEAMQLHLILYMNSFAPSSSLGQIDNKPFLIALVNVFKENRSNRENVELVVLKVLHTMESEPLIFQIRESPMKQKEFEIEVGKEILGAYTDTMVLEYNMLVKILRTLKAFMQRCVQAIPRPQKNEAILNHVKRIEDRLEVMLNLLKEVEDVCLDQQGGEAKLISTLDTLFCSHSNSK